MQNCWNSYTVAHHRKRVFWLNTSFQGVISTFPNYYSYWTPSLLLLYLLFRFYSVPGIIPGSPRTLHPHTHSIFSVVQMRKLKLGEGDRLAQWPPPHSVWQRLAEFWSVDITCFLPWTNLMFLTERLFCPGCCRSPICGTCMFLFMDSLKFFFVKFYFCYMFLMFFFDSKAQIHRLAYFV